MERMLLEYLVNSLWQAPLLALGAWLALRAGRPGPRVQHGVWVGALVLMVALPVLSLRGVAADGVASDGGVVAASTEKEFAQAEMQGGSNFGLVDGSALADGSVEQSMPSDAVAASGKGSLVSRWFRMRELPLSAAATHCVVEIYLAVIAFAMLRLLWSWVVARRMVAEAVPAEMTAVEAALFEDCCESLKVKPPRVLVSARTTSPLVVGVLRPALLLPEGFASEGEYSGRELEAVWWHELAHVRRRDYLANLMCRVWALPVAYHPATFAVERRVRQTREMVCDQVAAGEMGSPVGYARCLLGLAERMQHGAAMREQMQGAGLFDGGVLEERVVELIGTKRVVSGRMQAMRLAGSLAMVVGVMGAALMFHVMPTMAQASVVPEVSGVTPSMGLPATNAVQPAAVAEVPVVEPEQSVQAPKPTANVKPAPSAEEQADFAAAWPALVLKVGDRVLIRVVDFDAVPRQPIPIAAEGSVDLPMVGKIRVADRTPDQVKAELVAKLGKYILNPKVSVNLADENGNPVALGPGPVGLVKGSLEAQIRPEYPANALAERVSGLVVLDGIVTRKGAITGLKGVSGPGMLRQSALDAVRQWKWRPYLSDGYAIDQETRIGIQFVMAGVTPAESAADGAGIDERLVVYAAVPPQAAPVAEVQVPPSIQKVELLRAQMGEAAPKATYEPGFEIISNTEGREEFMEYFSHMEQDIRRNWEPLIPEEVRAPLLKKGVVGIRFTILPDGSVATPMVLENRSGDAALDKAAWFAITSEGKFPPLPKEFTGPKLELRMGFFYNTPVPNGREGGEPRPAAAGAVGYAAPVQAPVLKASYDVAQVVDGLQPQRGPDGLMRVPGAVMARNVISRPDPVYPPIAKAAHVQGAVTVNAVISKTGEVTYWAVANGPTMLQMSAVDAVKRWTYKPYLLNGVPVDVATTITVNFTFGDGGAASVDESVPDVLVSDVDAAPVVANVEAADGRLQVSAGKLQQNLVSRPDPVYPVEAKAARVQGAVVLKAVISKTGTVEDLQVVSGPEMLEASAIEAVSRWAYKPYLMNGAPVEVETTITVNFTFGV